MSRQAQRYSPSKKANRKLEAKLQRWHDELWQAWTGTTGALIEEIAELKRQQLELRTQWRLHFWTKATLMATGALLGAFSGVLLIFYLGKIC